MKPDAVDFKDVEYSSLDQERPYRKRWNLFSFSTGCASTIVLGAMLLATYHSLSIPKTAEELEDQDWNHCGRSSDAARARGCVMEPMFYGWMPPQCVYHELSDNYPIFENRKYWTDMNKTSVVTAEQLWAGEYANVYTDRYHDEHCLFQWRKLQFAMSHKMDYIDNKTASVGHSKHCADQLSITCEDAHKDDWAVNHVVLGFYRCRKTIW